MAVWLRRIACRRSASISACAGSPDPDEPLGDDAAVHEEVRSRLEGVVDVDQAGFGADRAVVADLPARLAVERGAVQNDLDRAAPASASMVGPSAPTSPRIRASAAVILIAKELGLCLGRDRRRAPRASGRGP